MAEELPLSVPVREIVIGALRAVDKHGGGLDRDEAYLLERLRRGEELVLTDPERQVHTSGQVRS